MAVVRLVNVTAAPVFVGDFGVTIQPGKSLEVSRPQGALASLRSVQQLYNEGKVSVALTYSDAEAASVDPGLLYGSGTGGAISQVSYIDVTSSATAQRGFFLPFGTYVRAQDILSVQLNGGLPLVAGTDYVAMQRQGGSWPQPTTADVVRGVWLTTAPGVGTVVRLTYVTRVLPFPAPVPNMTAGNGGTFLDPGPAAGDKIRWSYGSLPGQFPAQLFVAERKGMQVEVWRKTKKNGGVRRVFTAEALLQIRAGRHWTPWWRTPVAAQAGVRVISPSVEGWLPAEGQHSRVYKLCYYDPATGARSGLCDLTIHITKFPDHTAAGGIAHPINSMWVGK